MAHNCGVLLLLPVKFVCSAAFESVEGDSLTQGIKMRFLLTIDSKHSLTGKRREFQRHCLAAFNLLTCLASTKGLFPCSARALFIQCHSLDAGLLLITYKCVSGLDLSPGCSSV